MKRICFILVCLGALVSCENGNTSKNMNATSETQDAIREDNSAVISRVPSYDYEGLKQFLTNKNDSTYVINFWATWCKPCVKELPAFETLNKEYSQKKVKVLLVSLDFPAKIEQQVIPFLDKNNIKSQVVLLDDPDANTWIPAIDKKWSGAIPATIIYNSKKNTFYERSFTYEELKTEVESIL